MRTVRPSVAQKVGRMPAFKALRYRDFRLLWIGAFVSFLGSMVQNVAQGYLVFQLTGDRGMLAMVSFAMMLPVSLFGPVLGVVSDMFDKKKVLILCMTVSAVGPMFLGVAVWAHTVAYWHFLVVAAVSGFVQCVEVPTRQSIVRSVVAEEDLAAAIPAQASTFNLARVVGPALGAILAASFGAAVCFIANSVSFFALAIAAWAMRTDLRPTVHRLEPVKDLVLEGVRYTLRDRSLRVLFLLEAATSALGTFYLALAPAIAKEQLGLGQVGLGVMMSCVGTGAFAGLLLVAGLSQRRFKKVLVLVSMTTMSVALTTLGFAHVPAVAYALLAVTGASTIVQFNTTNTLFQLTAPPNLRGRVISMHMWAISGIAPLGVLVFGQVAKWFGTPASLWSGGGLLALVSLWGWAKHARIQEPTMAYADGAT